MLKNVWRQCFRTENPPNVSVETDTKRHKLELSVEHDNNETTFNTTLTDVNVDCQEVIFQYLNLPDLLNIVEAHKDFVEAARIIYSRCYKGKTVKINGTCWTMGESRITHTIKSDCIEIKDQRCFAQITSNFGDRIKKLSINFYNSNPIKRFFNEEIHDQINKFCVDSLVQLNLENCEHFSSEAFQQPFTTLCCLTMKNCELPFTSDNFYRLFPCLNRLELTRNTAIHPNFIECHIPTLEHLTLDSNKGFSTENILIALYYNQQLSNLHLVTHFNSKFLQSINILMPNLRNLQLVILSYKFTDEMPLNFKSVEKFTLTVDHGPFIDMSIGFEQLKELVIQINGSYGHDFTDFITKNQELTKLTIIAPSWNAIKLTDSDADKLGKPIHLTELILRFCHISNVAASDLMNNCKMLKRFQFARNKTENDLILYVDKREWKWTIANGSVLCERRRSS